MQTLTLYYLVDMHSLAHTCALPWPMQTMTLTLTHTCALPWPMQTMTLTLTDNCALPWPMQTLTHTCALPWPMQIMTLHMQVSAGEPGAEGGRLDVGKVRCCFRPAAAHLPSSPQSAKTFGVCLPVS